METRNTKQKYTNVYRRHKDTIEEVHLYNNKPLSGIRFRARTNTLQIRDRNNHSTM